MLAQAFLTAADLAITEPQRAALMKVLVLLETGKLKHVAAVGDNDERAKFSGNFNMANWKGEHSCGTVACIGGTAELIGRVRFAPIFSMKEKELKELFCPTEIHAWEKITTSQAATALRSYLTTGDARWDLATAGSV